MEPAGRRQEGAIGAEGHGFNAATVTLRCNGLAVDPNVPDLERSILEGPVLRPFYLSMNLAPEQPKRTPRPLWTAGAESPSRPARGAGAGAGRRPRFGFGRLFVHTPLSLPERSIQSGVAPAAVHRTILKRNFQMPRERE